MGAWRASSCCGVGSVCFHGALASVSSVPALVSIVFLFVSSVPFWVSCVPALASSVPGVVSSVLKRQVYYHLSQQYVQVVTASVQDFKVGFRMIKLDHKSRTCTLINW